MFFRHLSLFRFSPAVSTDLVRLSEAPAEHRLRPCGVMEVGTSGFAGVASNDAEAQPTLTVNNVFTLFAAAREDKLLPASVVGDALAKKVAEIATEEGRKVGGRERKRLRENLLTDMVPKAFVRSSRIHGYADTRNGWLVLDTSSRKAAEGVLTQLREALGSLPAVPLAPEEGPRVLLTDWLANRNLPAGFVLGDECELRDPASATGAIARFRNQEMDSEEMREHLRNGKQVFRLGLVYDERLSFVLGEDMVIRKLRFGDLVIDKLGDSHEDATSEAQASFTLMALELERLLTRIADIFALPRPEEA